MIFGTSHIVSNLNNPGKLCQISQKNLENINATGDVHSFTWWKKKETHDKEFFSKNAYLQYKIEVRMEK